MGCRGRPDPGRPKGSPNKITAVAKEALELAFEELGGVEQLTAWARSHRGEFYKLFARLIPIRNELPGGAEESTLAICVKFVSPPSREGV